MYDRVIVQDVIKGIAQTQQIDANAKHQFKGERKRYTILFMIPILTPSLLDSCHYRSSR